ncbi:hypothetical protein EPA93_20125 [Ktedonosporobacter rubrisoli]|uniref:Uncharacterized protein n=1 Tax=Ktedonosporobacter rubrisoli TaxID=2509675 RepID=A0A4P6JRS9_KTERU|nr:hypothetical protein [Ktedonosporobacter rubrisoli]QBD78179.1 hypothetical protein EPA93_20125 [Ktedonosporobacter rubrisoli]
MPYTLWVFLCIIAYIGGLGLIIWITPKLLTRSFDEGLFMGIAAMDIIGALLAFGAIVVIFAVFNGALAIRILSFVLLVGILAVTGRQALTSFRPRILSGTVQLSRIIAGVYCVLLAVASIFYMVQMFLS